MCVRLKTETQAWFITTAGVQGDALSPTTLFALFVNDLAIDIKGTHLGVPISNQDVSILLYADDIIFLAENKENLQRMQEWCKRWCLKVNNVKTNVVHYRSSRIPRTSFTFDFDSMVLEVVEKYKYLDVYFH